LHGARWYDSKIGRFISEDPIDADANTYRYAGNDPINYTDPTGLFQAGNPLNGLFSPLAKSPTPLINNYVHKNFSSTTPAPSTSQRWAERQKDLGVGLSNGIAR
jgi:uncharacterized protein RhaS with RHS repeats